MPFSVKAPQTGIREIRRLEHDVPSTCVAYQIVTERCDGAKSPNKWLLGFIQASVLFVRLSVPKFSIAMPSPMKKVQAILRTKVVFVACTASAILTR